MKTEIFYHEGQDFEVRKIREALSFGFPPTLEVVLRQITGTGQEYDEIKTKHYNATRYVQLLLASILPGTALEVTGIFAYGFYIYSTYYGRQINFQGDDIKKLFPAVAINDRMMLVPGRLGMTIGGADFRQIEEGGVIGVEFGALEKPDGLGQLKEAVIKVKDMLCSEAVHAMRNYFSYHKEEPVDLEKVAPRFGFDPAFVTWALQEEAARTTFYGHLSCDCEPTQLPIGQWTRVKITIRNDSGIGLSGLSVQVRGPVRSEPSRIETDVPPNGSARVDVALNAAEPGEFPLEIMFALRADRALEKWLPLHHPWFSAIGSA
jgi:hypothetical protein